jgi:hypothetical protein
LKWAERLKRAFDQLMFNFSWWVNRHNPSGKSVFEGLPRSRQYRHLLPWRQGRRHRCQPSDGWTGLVARPIRLSVGLEAKQFLNYEHKPVPGKNTGLCAGAAKAG